MIGRSNLKSVQEAHDAVKASMPPTSFGSALMRDESQVLLLSSATVVEASSLMGSGGDTSGLEAQIAQLTAQLATAQANLAGAQSALAIAQAQIDADTITIASLNAEVDVAEAQVVALQAQLAALAGRATYLYYPSLVEVLDNLYVPPYFVDDIVNATNAYLINQPVYYASLTIPTSGYP